MPKLHEGLNDAIVLYMLFFVFGRHQMDFVDVLVSWLIFRETKRFLTPLYQDCVTMA